MLGRSTGAWYGLLVAAGSAVGLAEGEGVNKQEALEAVLAAVRQWEAPTEEVRAVEGEQVLRELVSAAGDIDSLVDMTPTANIEEQIWSRLVTVGAAAVWLLTDEVEIVAGKSLDEWLAGGAGVSGLVDAATGRWPVVLNGTMGVGILRPTGNPEDR